MPAVDHALTFGYLLTCSWTGAWAAIRVGRTQITPFMRGRSQ